MRKIILVLIVSLFLATPAWAANEICNIDFENLPEMTLPEYDPLLGVSWSSRVFRNEHNQNPPCDGGIVDEGGEQGKVLKGYVQSTYIDGDSYTEPKLRFDNSIGGGREIYFKFDVRLDADLGTSYDTREMYNIKISLITDHTDASATAFSHWHPEINIKPSSSSCSLYQWSQGSGYGEYYFSRATTKLANHLMDNQWHTIEIYINIGSAVVTDKYDASADGIVRIWEDGVLILEDTAAPFRTLASEGQSINSAAFIRHLKSQGAPVYPMVGHIYFDNIQVCDGMPNEEPVTIDAVADSANVNEDSEVEIPVLDNDTGENLVIESATYPSHGTVQIVGDNILYTPDANYFGNDHFDYTVRDADNNTDSAQVSVTVNPVNDAPYAPQITPSFNAGDISLSWSCYDPDGDALTYDVLCDTVNPPQAAVAEGISQTSHTITDLEYSATYYIQVVAHDGITSTSSAIYPYTTEDAPAYNVLLEGQFNDGSNEITIVRGQPLVVQVRLTNNASETGDFMLSLQVLKHNGQPTGLAKEDSVTLDPGEHKTYANISFDTSNYARNKIYTIVLSAEAAEGEVTGTTEKILTVNID